MGSCLWGVSCGPCGPQPPVACGWLCGRYVHGAKGLGLLSDLRAPRAVAAAGKDGATMWAAGCCMHVQIVAFELVLALQRIHHACVLIMAPQPSCSANRSTAVAPI